MSAFDESDVFWSNPIGEQDDNLERIKKNFKEFLKSFNEGQGISGFKYKDELRKNYNLGRYFITIDIEDINSFDEKLADDVYKNPALYIPKFEEAATELADEVTSPRPIGEEKIVDIQVLLSSNSVPVSIRNLKSNVVSKLVKIAGIVISASSVRSKATKMAIQCRSCRTVVPNLKITPGLDGCILPRKCRAEQAGKPSCQLDPFFIMPDKCVCVDYQMLKLQEMPDSVPQGEMPRHVPLYLDRHLCDLVVPGNKVIILGILCIKTYSTKKKEGSSKSVVGVRTPYLRVVGITVDNKGTGYSSSLQITPEEEETCRRLANSPDIYERIAKSIAPSIFGFEDVKKSIACMLFGGARKQLPDGLTRRGDINVLLLGDPGTAKSQLLKFVQRVAPIGIYTSGKGSSAAGLTASVIRDSSSKSFIMEGGAMVLADGGVVSIDEFDKMREDDRVAIHEAMEQQTISIAKAGITTTLNSRCSVLAAANSVFGRWDDMKGDENINFMPTILSRFDMIFIVKDENDEQRDRFIAKHVMSVHVRADQEVNESDDGEMSVLMLKKLIDFCRRNCGPRLSNEAGRKLQINYVNMRKTIEADNGKKLAIPITVRQLEAIIRISESLAKMQMQPFVTVSHVDEALRLFKVSTLTAAASGNLHGAEGFISNEELEKMARLERQLKSRFGIGTQMSEKALVQEFERRKYDEGVIMKVIYILVQRQELMYRMQGKMLIRLK